MTSFGDKVGRAATLRVRARCLRGVAALVLGCAASPALGDVVVSVMTIDGIVQSVDQAPSSGLTRSGTAEDGRDILVDEFAVVGPGKSSVAFASAGFSRAEIRLTALALQPSQGLRPDQTQFQDLSVMQSRSPVLVIQHQRGHAANANFTPAPTVQFAPVSIATSQLDGERGFAVISVGESGRVLEVKTIAEHGRISNAKLRRALASGITSTFVDERRHDHTVYLAFEIDAGTVVQIGKPVVTFPMCVNHCPP